MESIDSPKQRFSSSEDLLSVIRLAVWHIPEQIRVLWHIPIEEVIEALGWKFEDVDDCEFEYDMPWNKIMISINLKSNDWKFGIVDTGGDIFLPLDFEEIKTTIDLVMFLEGYNLNKAIEFLLEKFPNYKIQPLCHVQ